MFLGHIGTGLAAKRVAPRVSLGWLIAAPVFLDLLWPIFLLLGWESVNIDPGVTVVTPLDFVSYPISHSLAAAVAWGVGLGGLYSLIRRDGRAALLIGALVPSHWALDWVVHRPDLPLYPGGPKFGLGLWNSFPATLLAEGLTFGLGVGLYVCVTRGPKLGVWVFTGLLVLIYCGNLFGPAPETADQVAYVTLALWLLPPWAWSYDRRRRARKAGLRESS